MVTIETRVEEPRGCGFRQEGGKYLVSGGVMGHCDRLPIPCDVCPVCHSGIKPSRGWTWIELPPLLGLCEPGAAEWQVDYCELGSCRGCPLNGTVHRAGLLWIGEQFYPTMEAFLDEARRLGVSRRISAVPKDFKIGETWVLFAHRKGISKPCEVGLERSMGCVGCQHFQPHAVLDGYICEEQNCDCVKYEPGLVTYYEKDHPNDCECEGSGVIWTPAMFHAFKPTAIEYIVKESDTEEHLERLVEQGFTLVRVIRGGEPLLDQQVIRRFRFTFFKTGRRGIEKIAETVVEEEGELARLEAAWAWFEAQGHKRTLRTFCEEKEIVQ